MKPRLTAIVMVSLLVLLVAGGEGQRAHAATFSIADGDVAGLIAAINTANGNGEANVIGLAPGGTYTLTAADNPGNGLPVMTGQITIDGNGATIKRSGSAPSFFRILSVTASADVTLNGVTISGGYQTDDAGGGIYNAGTLTLNGSTVSGNRGKDAGGIFNPSGALTLNDSTVSGNNGGNKNGGIYNFFGTLILNRSTVRDNTAFGVGGIRNSQGTAVLNSSTVSGNKATVNFVGGILNECGGGGSGTDMIIATTTLTNSTVSGNSAITYGGGIVNLSAHLSGCVGATLILNNSTVSDNTAGDGGGIVQDPGNNNPATIFLKNSIVAGNAGTPHPECSGTITSLGYNLSTDDTCLGGTGDINDAPLLGPLANNGGPTRTHALLAGSPAINAVLPPDCTDAAGQSIAADQRGVSRPRDAACDIGAVEFVQDGTTVPGAPTNATATAGNAQISVGFTAPQSDGGSPIITYTATCGSQSASGAGSPIVVGGLTNGISYTCTVTATNAVGTGPPSAPSNSATPTAPPVLSIELMPTFGLITAGGFATFTIVVTNNGPGDAYGVTITDPLPSGATLTWSVGRGSDPGCRIEGVGAAQMLSCAVGPLAEGASFTAQVIAPTSAGNCPFLYNVATASATNAATVNAVGAITCQEPVLTVEKTPDGGSITAGADATFTIMVTNNGPGEAWGVTVSDPLPSSLAWSVTWSIVPAPGVPPAPGDGCQISAQTLSCTQGILAAGASLRAVVTAPTSVGNCPTLINQAWASATNAAPASDVGDITCNTPVSNVTVTSLVRAMPSPTMADTVDYTLTFSGPVSGVAPGNFALAASGITGASVVSATGSGTTQTVTVNTGRGTGTLQLSLANASGITDPAVNVPISPSLPFLGETYEIDKGGTVIGAGEGQPEASFGTGGYGLFYLPQAVVSPGAVAALPSGKILAAGGASCVSGGPCSLEVAQYLADGTRDTGFASGGQVLWSIGISPDLGALIANNDGTFFVAGSWINGATFIPFVAKFTSNGAPDTTFYDTGLSPGPGWAQLPFLHLDSPVTGAAVDGSGGVVLAGTRSSAGPPAGTDLFVARLTTTGGLDSSFGSGGTATFNISTTGSHNDSASDVVVQPNGKIVVGGHTEGVSGSDFLLLRLKANGTPDNSFGNGGMVTARFAGSTGDNAGRKLALQPDGKIVLVGPARVGASDQCGVARFNGNGTPDATFGTNGQVLIPLTQGCLAVTVQPDGKLVVTALERQVDVTYATYVRLLANGAPDPSFGTNGILSISSYSAPTRVAVTASGNLVSGVVIEDPPDGIHKSYVVQLASQMAQPTTTTITQIVPSPALTGQVYRVGVMVSAASGTPTGTVNVSDGAGASCSITLAGGFGSCPLISTTKGGKTITATYGGSSGYLASSDTRPQNIQAANTATMLVVSANPVLVGTAVTLTATVIATSPGANTPSGAVTVSDGATTLTTLPLNAAGGASYTYVPAPGNHILRASYTGNPDYFNASTSAGLNLDVQPLPTLRFSSNSVNVSQTVGTVTLTVLRTGSTLGPVAVTYSTQDGSAFAGIDYTAVPGTLVWAPGDGSPQTISVRIINRGHAGPFANPLPSRTFTVRLFSPSGATLGNPSVVTVTIH